MQDKRETPEQEAFVKKLVAFSETLNAQERASLIMTLQNPHAASPALNVDFFRRAVLAW